jgi:hypothetical protein
VSPGHISEHTGRPLPSITQARFAAADDAALTIAVRRIGPALVFERLWEETSCRAVIVELASKRKHGFALERAVLLSGALRSVYGSV